MAQTAPATLASASPVKRSRNRWRRRKTIERQTTTAHIQMIAVRNGLSRSNKDAAASAAKAACNEGAQFCDESKIVNIRSINPFMVLGSKAGYTSVVGQIR